MALIPRDEHIKDFWDWFGSVAGRLSADFQTPDVLDQLDDRLSALGDIVWELGPGILAENSLAVSPDGALEWLPVTQRIVELAPVLAGWEFHSSRPPRTWALQFGIDDDGRRVDVDARKWIYVLYRISPSSFDIVIDQEGLRDVTDETRYAAAIVVLDGILGEAERLSKIRDIELAKLTPAEALKAKAMLHLKKHWALLASRARQQDDPHT